MGLACSKIITIAESIDLNDLVKVKEILEKYYDLYDSLDAKSKKQYDELHKTFMNEAIIQGKDLKIYVN